MGVTPVQASRVAPMLDVPEPPKDTAEMLASLPDGLMVPDGAHAEERRVSDVLALYRAVFLNSPDPISIIDARGRYLEQNSAHERVLGYTADELRGKTPAVHMGDEVFAGVMQDLQRHGVVQREVRSRAKDGTLRVIDLSAFAVRDRKGRPVCYVGIERDVTSQRLAESEQQRLVAELRGAAAERERLLTEASEANRTKAVFLATMSHELRTPLNAIAGYTDLLDAAIHGDLSAKQREAIQRIQANQRHLLRLIDDVLDFAKLEAGHLQLEMSDVPVQETLESTRAIIEPQLRAKDITLECASGDPLVTCRADRAKMQQILVNLLSNAWKFTPAGGAVAVDWEANDDVVRIHVRDSGPGIDAASLELIFAPFVQLHAGLRRRAEGTGLGLSISRELARGMGGDVTVASTPGAGATFTLSLPRR